MLLAMAALALVACEKKSETTNPEPEPAPQVNHYVTSTFSVKMQGPTMSCFKVDYTIVDFDGKEHKGTVNENFDGKDSVSFVLSTTATKAGQKATIKCQSSLKEGLTRDDFKKMIGPWYMLVATTTECQGKETDFYGVKEIENNQIAAIPEEMPNTNFFDLLNTAINRYYGSHILTITRTEDGYDIDCPAE